MAVIVVLIKKLSILTLLGSLLRISLTKYNAERHLQVIYRHRVAVLEQYDLFDKSILADDVSSRNQFRIEVSRMIFNDPKTGYSKSEPELNFSQMIGGLVPNGKTSGSS